jgi:hypothetical protein
MSLLDVLGQGGLQLEMDCRKQLEETAVALMAHQQQEHSQEGALQRAIWFMRAETLVGQKTALEAHLHVLTKVGRLVAYN